MATVVTVSLMFVLMHEYVVVDCDRVFTASEINTRHPGYAIWFIPDGGYFAFG